MQACLKCGGAVRQDKTVHGMHPSCADAGAAAGAADRIANTYVPSAMERERLRQENAALTEEYRAARKVAEKAASKQAREESAGADSTNQPAARADEKAKG